MLPKYIISDGVGGWRAIICKIFKHKWQMVRNINDLFYYDICSRCGRCQKCLVI